MPPTTIARAVIIQSVAGAVLGALLLFLPAGTFAWPQAWIFLGLFYGCSEATGLWLLRHDPALLAARMKSPIASDQRPRDRAIMVAILDNRKRPPVCFRERRIAPASLDVP